LAAGPTSCVVVGDCRDRRGEEGARHEQQPPAKRRHEQRCGQQRAIRQQERNHVQPVAQAPPAHELRGGAPDPCDIANGDAEDVDGNGVVDALDLLALLGAWGACPMP
jgi:hypothetical protein